MDIISLASCFLAFLLYYNTLDAGFVYDDRRAILTNPDILATTPWLGLLQNDFWGTPLKNNGSHGSYRPLCVASFRLNHLLGGFQPWGYHLVNVLLHCLATGLVVRVARKIFPANCIPVGPAIAGLLFATHPVHTEAVAGIVGRADLAACNFYLLSFLAYVAHIKYRGQKCNKLIPELCVCCDPNSSKKKISKDQIKCRKVSPKYHTFVMNLPRQVTNCNWPNKIGTSTEFTWYLSLFRSTNSNKCGNIVNNKSENFSSACKCLSREEKCLGRKIKQWSSLFACIFCAVCTVLCKETGITVLVVCGIYDMICSNFSRIQKKQLRSLLIIGITLLAIVLLRLQLTLGNTPEFATADNPTARSLSITTRFLTFAYLPTFNFKLLLCPVTLSFDWGMDAIPKITSICDSRNVISVLFYSVLYQAIRRCAMKLYNKNGKKEKIIRNIRKKVEALQFCNCHVCHHGLSENHSLSCRTNNNNNISCHSACICPPLSSKDTRNTELKRSPSQYATFLLSLAFLTLPFMPATNLFFYVGFVVAERVLYLPSVGYSLLIGLGVSKLKRTKNLYKVSCFGILVLLLVFSVKTIRRNRDWLNEESLYRSAISVNPPKAYGNLGSVLSSQGRTQEAEWAYRKALEYRANMADVHYNLGNLLQGKQKYEEAIESYQKAIHFRPSLALAYVNLGAALVSAGRCQEAVSVLRRGSRLDGSGLKDRRTHDTARVSALLQLGALYTDQGRLRRALATYREALHTMPQYYPPQSVYNLLGETLTRLEQFDEAERWYQAALQAQPDHVPAHITYGKLLAKNGSRVAEAEQWFRRAQKLAPSDPSVYHHYGEFLAGQSRHVEAAVQYVRAAELRPRDYDLATSAATALRQAGRAHEAEVWYKRAVAIRPQDARGHTNLGAILHLNGKYELAADSYRRALRLQPDDVTTLTNLHKLYTVMS